MIIVKSFTGYASGLSVKRSVPYAVDEADDEMQKFVEQGQPDYDEDKGEEITLQIIKVISISTQLVVLSGEYVSYVITAVFETEKKG